jgi:hypothetical protein
MLNSSISARQFYSKERPFCPDARIYLGSALDAAPSHGTGRVTSPLSLILAPIPPAVVQLSADLALQSPLSAPFGSRARYLIRNACLASRGWGIELENRRGSECTVGSNESRRPTGESLPNIDRVGSLSHDFNVHAYFFRCDLCEHSISRVGERSDTAYQRCGQDKAKHGCVPLSDLGKWAKL